MNGWHTDSRKACLIPIPRKMETRKRKKSMLLMKKMIMEKMMKRFTDDDDDHGHPQVCSHAE